MSSSSLPSHEAHAKAALLKHASLLVSVLILLAATVMFGWGVLGMLEYFTGWAPLMPLQNANFPSGTQLVHWILILGSGGTYLVGYFTKWRPTPYVMVVWYAMLPTLCAIETFDFMTRPDRYSAYAREVAYYIGFGTFLLRSRRMKDHFGHG